jgi:hypothetical protein
MAQKYPALRLPPCDAPYSLLCRYTSGVRCSTNKRGAGRVLDTGDEHCVYSGNTDKQQNQHTEDQSKSHLSCFPLFPRIFVLADIEEMAVPGRNYFMQEAAGVGTCNACR